MRARQALLSNVQSPTLRDLNRKVSMQENTKQIDLHGLPANAQLGRPIPFLYKYGLARLIAVAAVLIATC